MKKAYMVCDTYDQRASECGAWHVGIERMGNCSGRIVDEDGNTLGQHGSSSFGWLRLDLANKVAPGEYEIVDLIGQPVPERFAVKP